MSSIDYEDIFFKRFGRYKAMHTLLGRTEIDSIFNLGILMGMKLGINSVKTDNFTAISNIVGTAVFNVRDAEIAVDRQIES